MRQPLLALTRDDSQAVKGLAILLMIMHHVLIPEYYVTPWAQLSGFVGIHMMMLGKLCVGLFAFVTAYGYAFSKRRDLKYSLSHVFRLLKIYWPILIITVILSALWTHQFDLKAAVWGLIGFSAHYNCASWYVSFYIFAMLILPLVARLVDTFKVVAVLAFVVLCGILCMLLAHFDLMWVVRLRVCLFYTPVLAVGYYLGKFDWSKVKMEFPVFVLFLILVAGLVISAMWHTIGGFTPYTITAPMVVFSMAALFRGVKAPHLYAFLKWMGKLSVYMWFIHAIFFSSATRMIFQQQSFWPDNIVLVFLLVAVASIVIATLIVKAKDRLKTI